MNRCTGNCHQSDAPCNCQPDDELTLAEEAVLALVRVAGFALALFLLGIVWEGLRNA